MVRKVHPVWQLRSELFLGSPSLVVEFSRYVYRTYGLTESRDVFHVPSEEITDSWFSERVADLNPDQEMAVHSRIMLADRVFHIPMIDFVNAVKMDEIQRRMRHINKWIGKEIWIYKSGRSLHGYYFTLVDETVWKKFLGKLLLCNSRGEFPNEIIDSRWIGHSLDHGFSALRWSQNTERHQSPPILLGATSSQNIRIRK